MNKENTMQANYSVHTFMTEGMKLSGTRLLVYALIYSFSRHGEFSGSRRYIASATGATLRTVDRAIDFLLERGYIACGDELGRQTYKADVELADSWRERCAKESKKVRKNDSCQNDTPPVSKCRAEEDKMTPNNQEIIKNINCLSSSSRTRKPKYNVKSYGREGYVSLSEEQYEYLCTLIDEELLHVYIRKLEMYISEKLDHPVRSHFKTLLRFIEEDFALPKGVERVKKVGLSH